MPVPNEKIVAAAKVLEGFRVNILVGGTMFAVPAPQIEALMVLVQAAPQIAERFSKVDAKSPLNFGLFTFNLDKPLFGPEGLLSEASARVRNRFRNERLTTLRALMEYDKHVLDLHDFGKKSFMVVRELLRLQGLNPDEYKCLQLR